MIPYGYYGPFRVYFNRHNEFPRVWSIDCGSQETETPVEGVYFVNLQLLSTQYLRKGQPTEPDNLIPSAVIFGRGLVRIEGDCAFVDGGLVPSRISWLGLQKTRLLSSLGTIARKLRKTLRPFETIGATLTLLMGITTDIHTYKTLPAETVSSVERL